MKRKLLICVNLFVILTMIMPVVGLARPNLQDSPDPPGATATISPDAVPIDLRDHGTDPETTIALVNQSVVWTNNGTKSHTITEGDPVFSIYLSLTMRGTGSSAVQQVSDAAQPSSYTPVFNSGTLLPGERYTYTFTTTGVYTYYSATSPGNVVGKVIVVEPMEEVSEPATEGSALVVSTSSGASFKIGAGVLLTDTVASITEISGDILDDPEVALIGDIYDIKVLRFSDVVSGEVSITLPYDPALVPGGTDSNHLELMYFNGTDWIDLGGTVDTVQHTISISATHLSLYIPVVSCWRVLGYTTEEMEDISRAKDFITDIYVHQDFYAAFKTSNGTQILDLPYEGRAAEWIANTSICKIYASDTTTIWEKLQADATGPEVIESMRVLGENINKEGDDLEAAAKVVDILVETGETILHSLHILEIAEDTFSFTPTTVLPSLILHILKNSAYVALDWHLASKMDENAADIADWLVGATEVGQSNLTRETERTEMLVSGYDYFNTTCSPPVDYNQGFYRYIVPGGATYKPAPNERYWSIGFANLFEKNDELNFIIGIQDANPFRDGFIWIDRTDKIFVMLEYEDTSTPPNQLVAVMPFKNYLSAPIPLAAPPCMAFAGRITLPNAAPGTEVIVKFILEEKGHLDKRFIADGFFFPVSAAGEQLCYGKCSETPATPGETILIPAGEFQMGCDPAHNGGYSCDPDELPLHTVYLDAYRIDKYEVTNSQYAAFLNSRGHNDCNGYECIDMDDVNRRIFLQDGHYVVESGYEDHPVVEVTWYGADAYCVAEGKRLPTEAEWEKAARGPSVRAFPWGAPSPDCTYANHDYCVGDTTQVGSYPSGASSYGALDMAGNVWEWVNDWYDSDYYSVSPYSNPPGPDTGNARVLRGASWSNNSYNLRTANRNRNYPYGSDGNMGFRCASSGE